MRDTVGENLEKNHGNLGDIKVKVSKSKEYLKTGAQVFNIPNTTTPTHQMGQII